MNDGGGSYRFVWSYKTDNYSSKVESENQHTGTHFLNYEKFNGLEILKGYYINNRLRTIDETRGAYGTEIYVKVKKNLEYGSHYNDKTWKMKKPNTPIHEIDGRALEELIMTIETKKT